MENLTPLTNNQPEIAKSASALPPLPQDFTTKSKAESEKKIVAASAKPTSKALPVIVFLLIAIIGIFIPVYIISQSNQKAQQQAQSNKVTIETTNTEIKEAISKQFVYASGDIGDYYSPSIDSSFTLDQSTVYVSENGKDVTISPKGFSEIYGTISLTDAKTSPYDAIKAEYASWKDTTVTEPEVKEFFTKFQVSYKSDNYLVKGESFTQYLTYYYKKDADKSKYVLIKVSSKAPITEETEALYAGILKTITISPENVATDIAMKFTGSGAGLSFNKKKWSVSYQGENGASLQYVSEKNTDPSVYFSISTFETSNKDMARLKDQAKSDITYIEKNYQNFKQVKDIAETTVASQDAISYTISYTSGSNDWHKTVYLGFSKSTSAYFTMEISIAADNGEMNADYAKSDIANLVGSLKFDEISSTLANYVPDNVLGETTLNIDKGAIIGKTATVHIAVGLCSRLTISDTKMLPNVSAASKKTTPLCARWTGSGFYISKDGYIMTNAHVAAPSLLGQYESELFSPSGIYFKAIAQELLPSILAARPELTETQAGYQTFVGIVQTYIAQLVADNKITVQETSKNIYVEKGTPFAFTKNAITMTEPAKYLTAELVKGNALISQAEFVSQLIKDNKKLDENPYSLSLVADLAIIKVDDTTTEFPTLELGNLALVTPGSQLMAIGFPGIADSAMYSETSSTTATITKGTVSAIKDNPTNSFKLIQTDASIKGGNSGGPMINTEGQVLAVSTWGNSTSDSYNIGVGVDAINTIISEAGVTLQKSDFVKLVNSGVANMQKEYYQWAVRDFDAAIKLYAPSQAELSPLRLLSQEKITQGLDNTPVAEISGYYIHKKDLPYIFGALAIAFIAFIALIIVLLRKGKRSSQAKSMPPTATQVGPTVPSNFPTAPAPFPPAEPVSPMTQTMPTLPSVEKPAEEFKPVMPIASEPAMPASFGAPISQPFTESAPTPTTVPAPQLPQDVVFAQPEQQAPISSPSTPSVNNTAATLFPTIKTEETVASAVTPNESAMPVFGQNSVSPEPTMAPTVPPMATDPVTPVTPVAPVIPPANPPVAPMMPAPTTSPSLPTFQPAPAQQPSPSTWNPPATPVI